MSKYSYTPGPWVCHSGAVYKDGPNVWPKGEENGIPIAKMDREPDNGIIPVERDANARLIAAAPELLKALHKAREHLEFCGYGDRYERDCAYGEGLPKLIDEAIDKAEPK